MFFSIIVPVYNVKRYLEECVESVLNQTYCDYELILVDDGSTDGSGKMCDDISKRDRRIKVYHKKNGGLSDARNCGLRYASGEYVIFLDSDDYWNGTDSLKNIWNRVSESRCDILVFNRLKLYESGEKTTVKIDISRKDVFMKTQEEALQYMIKTNAWKPAAWNKVILTKLLRDSQIEFEKGRLHEDLLWCCRIMLQAESFDYYEFPVYVYRQRMSSITRSIKEKNLTDINIQLDECIGLAENYSGQLQNIIYSYCAYDYSVLLGFTGFLNREGQKKYSDFLQDKIWLLDYGLSEKVKKVRLLYKTAGYKITVRLLAFFMKHKK